MDVTPLSPDRFRDVLEPEAFDAFRRSLRDVVGFLDGRSVWNVSSTTQGGGVAEMLGPLVGYQAGGGIDARWSVIEADDDFFRITKRIHNLLHGSPGDGEGLSEDDRVAYEAVLERNAADLEEATGPGDIVILHDPQTVGLASAFRDAGARVAWCCHVGIDDPPELTRGAWAFLLPYAAAAEAYVFTRRQYVWDGLDDDRVHLIPPVIDAFSPKNQALDPETVGAILARAGIAEDGSSPVPPEFQRPDGSVAEVERRAVVTGDGPLGPDQPLVVQVSRWDRLKDPMGVLEGFVGHVSPRTGAHLVLAGPEVDAVSDDPEEREVLEEVRERWSSLPDEARARVHVVEIPMADVEENAAVVNAIQRRATLIVQKSLAEGFGLTVAEGMWKGRPTLGSRVGGIQDQIVDGDSGLLVDDPRDLASFGRAVTTILEDGDTAERLGRRGQERVRERFLAPRYLTQLGELMGRFSVAARC